MKLKISHSILLIVFCIFFVTVNASTVQNSLIEPSKTRNKRDVVDLHNTGSKTTTTTTTQNPTATVRPPNTPDASPASSDPSKNSI